MDTPGLRPWGPQQAALAERLQHSLVAWCSTPAPLEAGIRHREEQRRLQRFGEAGASGVPSLWHARLGQVETRGHQNTVVAAVEHLLNRMGQEVQVHRTTSPEVPARCLSGGYKGPLAAQFNEDRELQEVDGVTDLAVMLGTVDGVRLVQAQAASVNTGNGEAGALMKLLDEGGIVLWPYDASDVVHEGYEGVMPELVPDRARGHRARYMIITGFMLPYAGVGQVQEGGPSLLTVHISSREGNHAFTSDQGAHLPPEAWMASAPGNEGYRSSQLLLVGCDAASGDTIVASFAALRSSNAQLQEIPMLEYENVEGMEIDQVGGDAPRGEGMGAFRRGRRLAGRCVILAAST